MGLGVTILLVGLGAAAPSPEECWLTSNSHWVVEAAKEDGARLIEMFRKRDGAFPFRGVVVNGRATSADTLVLRILVDGVAAAKAKRACPDPRGSRIGVARDDRSIGGGCQASPGLIECSQGTLESAARRDHDGRAWSPGLFYLLAHEVAHVARGHTGRFSAARQLLDLSLPEHAKLALLRVEPTAILELERDADRIALDVLSSEVIRRAKLTGASDSDATVLSEAAAIVTASGRVRLSAADEQEWEDGWGPSGTIPRLVDEPRLPADPTYIRWASLAVFCDVMKAKKGHVALPFLDGSHPRPAARMREISQKLAEASQRASANVPNNPTLPMHLSVPISEVASITQKLDEEYEAFLSGLTAEFARAVEKRLAGQDCGCGALPRTPPPKTE